ncbi:MAG: glycosyltransferase [Thermoguttaceae bacterium]
MNRPVRVCFLIDRLGVGGTESQLLALIRGLHRAVVRPYLCLLDGEDPVSRSLEPGSCPVLRLGVRSLRSPWAFRQAWRFARFLRRERIEVVQTHFPDSSCFGALVARLAGVRLVIGTQRDLGFWMRPTERWLGRLCSWLTHVTLANSQACRQAAIAEFGRRPESVIVVPNGIDLARFAAIPAYGELSRFSHSGAPSEGESPAASLPNPDGRLRRIGKVANLRPVKGPDVFVRAAAIISRSHPEVRFQLVGTGDEAIVRRLAQACGIGDQFELLGHVSDIPSFLSTLDVAVLTSYSEGLSNSLLEYMAAGRPIVATAVGGNVELIEDGVHGLLVPPGDPAAVAAAVERLLGDPALAARLAAAARTRARHQFTAEAMVHSHESFYRTLRNRNLARV